MKEIEEKIMQQIMDGMSLSLSGGTCTESSATTELSMDAINEAVKLLEHVKTPVFCFPPLLDSSILKGEAIDLMLQCSEHEEGYLIPIQYRDFICKEFVGGPFNLPLFTERCPSFIRGKK